MTEKMSQAQAQDKFLPTIINQGKVYHKKTEILARPAQAGEVVVTVTSDGKETQNTAKDGDYVVKNLTGAGEEYILTASKLAGRYQYRGEEGKGWCRYKATGSVTALEYVPSDFDLPDVTEFEASWGEMMKLKAGDMLATPDGKEVYRIARQEFNETYGG